MISQKTVGEEMVEVMKNRLFVWVTGYASQLFY